MGKLSKMKTSDPVVTMKEEQFRRAVAYRLNELIEWIDRLEKRIDKLEKEGNKNE